MEAIDAEKPWVVLKFGGTSVSSSFSWKQIASRVHELVPTNRVWVVISALTNVSNHLEKAIEEAIASESSTKLQSFEWIRETHYKLAADFNLSESDLIPLNSLFEELKRLLEGISLLKEASSRVRGRVMAHGELFSTLMGIPILKVWCVDASFTC
jgi:aspartokinase